MAFSKYPESLDDSSTLPVSIDNVTPVNSEVVNRLRSSIISTQTELGVAPSGTFGSVRDRLNALDTLVASIETTISGGGQSVSALTTQVNNLSATLTSHVSNTSNPHSTTAALVGAPNLVATSTDEALVRFSGTSGQMQNSINGPYAADTGELRLINNINLTGRNSGDSTWVPLIGLNSSNELTLGGLGNVDVILNANNNVAANISNSRASLNGYLEVNSSLGTTTFPTTGGIRLKGGANNNGIFFQSTLGSAVNLITHDATNNIVIGSNTAGTMAGFFPSVPTNQGMFFRIGGVPHISLNEVDMDIIVPVRLTEQASDPVDIANTGAIYTKEDTAITELFYIDDTGTVTQITSDGYLNPDAILNNVAGTGTDNTIARWDGNNELQDSGIALDDSDNASGFSTISIGSSPAASGIIRLPNNQNISFRNVADSSDIRAIRVDGSNNTILGENAGFSETFVDGTVAVSIRLGSSSPHTQFLGSGIVLRNSSLGWGSTTPSPVIQHASTSSGNGNALTISSQSSTDAGSIGGDLILRPGAGTSTNGELELQDAGGTPRFKITNQNVAEIASNVRVTSTATSISGPNVRWDAATANPILSQSNQSSTDNGDTLTIQAQNNINVGSGDGGDLALLAGTSTAGAGGDINIDAGSGVTDGNINIGSANAVETVFGTSLRMIEVATPADVANYGSIYVQDVSAISELFYIDDAGAVTQITSDGYLNADAILGSVSGTGADNTIARWDGTSSLQDSGISLDDSDNASGINSLSFSGTPATAGTIRLGNNQAISARDSGDTADYDLIKLTGSNSVEVGYPASIVQTDTGAALTVTNSGGVNPQIFRGVNGALASKFQILGTSGALIGTETAHQFAIYTQNTPRLTFDASGSLSTFSTDVAIGSSVSATGAVRLPNNQSINFRNSGNSADLVGIASNSFDRITVGGSGVDRVILTADTQTVQVQSNGLNLVTPSMFFDSGQATPQIFQADDNTASATGDTFTIRPQNCTGATSTGGSLVLRPGTGTSTNGHLYLQDAGSTPRISINPAGDVFLAPTSLAQIDGILRFGTSGFAANGTIRGPNGFSIYARDVAGAADALLMVFDGLDDLTIGEDADVDNVRLRAASGLDFRIGGTTRISADSNSTVLRDNSGAIILRVTSSNFVDIYADNFLFDDAVLNPDIYQGDETTTADGDTLTVRAQSNTNVSSGDGGNLILRSGSANAGVGGDVFLQAGASTASTDGRVFIGNSNTSQTYVDSANGVLIRAANADIFSISGTGVFLTQNNFQFDNTTSPNIFQQPESTTIDGRLFTISAQNNTNGTSGEGGALLIKAGDSTADVGGDLTLRAGDGVTGGSLRIQDPSGAVNALRVRDDGKLFLSAVSLEVSTASLAWAETATSPLIFQQSDSTASTTGQTFTLESQGVTGTGTNTGGRLRLNGGGASGAGTTNNGGDVVIRGGDATNASTNNGGDVVIECGAGNTANGEFRVETASNVSQFRVDELAVYVETNFLSINENQTNPIWSQTADAAADATADNWTISAQPVTGSGTTIRGGDLILLGGESSGGSATNRFAGNVRIAPGSSNVNANHGNISLMTNATSYQGMARGIFLGDSTAEPTGQPSSGGFLLSSGGDLKWRGSGGTQTTVAATGGSSRMQILRYADRVTTTGTSTILTIPSSDIIIGEEGVINVEARFTAHDQTENSGAAWTTFAAFRYDGGTITEITTESDDHLRQDWIDSWSVDIVINGTDFDIDVTSDGASVIFSCWADVYVALD